MRDHVERLIDQETYFVIESIRSMAAMMRAEKVTIREIFVQPHRIDTSIYLLEIDSLPYVLWFLSNSLYVRRLGSIWGPLFGFHLLTRAGDDLTIGKIGFNRQIVKIDGGLGPPTLVRCDRASSKIGGKYHRGPFKHKTKLVTDPSKWPTIKKFLQAELKGRWNASYAIVLNQFNSRVYWLEIETETSVDCALVSSADSAGIFI